MPCLGYDLHKTDKFKMCYDRSSESVLIPRLAVRLAQYWYWRYVRVLKNKKNDYRGLVAEKKQFLEGSVVMVSSICGRQAFPNYGFYCMTKSALDMYSQTLALELAQYGIRVNAVNSGPVITKIQTRAGMGDEALLAYTEKSKHLNPLKRNGDVEEIADVIAFLASSRASFVTGSSILADGGRALVCSPWRLCFAPVSQHKKVVMF